MEKNGVFFVSKPGGCDNVLNSTKRNDNCGVCDGDNSSCDEVSKELRCPSTYGYHDIVEIPEGATNIKVIHTRAGNGLGCLGSL